jgi:hypothetical protein
MQVNHGPGILPGLPGGPPYVSAEEVRAFWKGEVQAVSGTTLSDFARAQQHRRWFEVRP